MLVFVGSAGALALIAAVLVLAEHFTARQYGLDMDAALSTATRVVLLTGATYAGIVAQVLTAHLKRLAGARISFAREFRRATSTADFWLAVLASPIVLSVAYGAIAQVASLVMVATIGFQNGFFFHSILSKHPGGAVPGRHGVGAD